MKNPIHTIAVATYSLYMLITLLCTVLFIFQYFHYHAILIIVIIIERRFNILFCILMLVHCSPSFYWYLLILCCTISEGNTSISIPSFELFLRSISSLECFLQSWFVVLIGSAYFYSCVIVRFLTFHLLLSSSSTSHGLISIDQFQFSANRKNTKQICCIHSRTHLSAKIAMHICKLLGKCTNAVLKFAPQINRISISCSLENCEWN